MRSRDAQQVFSLALSFVELMAGQAQLAVLGRQPQQYFLVDPPVPQLESSSALFAQSLQPRLLVFPHHRIPGVLAVADTGFQIGVVHPAGGGIERIDDARLMRGVAGRAHDLALPAEGQNDPVALLRVLHVELHPGVGLRFLMFQRIEVRRLQMAAVAKIFRRQPQLVVRRAQRPVPLPVNLLVTIGAVFLLELAALVQHDVDVGTLEPVFLVALVTEGIQLVVRPAPQEIRQAAVDEAERHPVDVLDAMTGRTAQLAVLAQRQAFRRLHLLGQHDAGDVVQGGQLLRGRIAVLGARSRDAGAEQPRHHSRQPPARSRPRAPAFPHNPPFTGSPWVWHWLQSEVTSCTPDRPLPAS
ncbi:hypothetical protein MCA0429 [Methylococcus capsulatus str. Bath]|uniref:Uncharacterized protein n=1 Tax=Methylococcus capsulatus (strain ATCC 33009 / NCIMB 11132 / Bath) TaxID=243233 RepID=Q60BN7_METCA|nr:hypothetical protein MCA0429 [Methylococcus capsulatus str. Bath]